MVHSVLENLKTDEFALQFSSISNPRAVHKALQRSKAVEDLRLALQRGGVTEPTLRTFSAALLKSWEHGKRFPYELPLAAIVVALETRPTSFAQEFVADLARLEVAELPIAIRVAREAHREQLATSASKTKVFTLMGEEPLPTAWQEIPKFRPVLVGQSQACFELGAA